METVLGLIVGIGLAASCGFRVFVPLLIVSVSEKAGYLQLADGFAWMGTWPAIIAFTVATLIEVIAYWVPWLDHLLDTVSSPAAVVAGSVLTAACVGEVDPFLKWSLAVIAGGGVAGLIQGGTLVARSASTTTTAGAANPVVSTLEAGASLFFSVMAVFLPILGFILLLMLIAVGIYMALRMRRAGARLWPFKRKHAALAGPAEEQSP